MLAPLLNERDIDFMLYELLATQDLVERERYKNHDKHTFTEVIKTAKTIAEKHFLPIRQKLDTHQPEFDGVSISNIDELPTALTALNDSGLNAATADKCFGGMQVPPIISGIATGYLLAAGGNALGYSMLTNANANLLQAHGSQALKDKWLVPLRAGRFAGTMAMTEPGSGSGLADLITKAEKNEDGSYRITGNKIFISGGDHNLSENIVHLVLARVVGAPKGVKGISLFVVPKILVNDDGSLGAPNDVALAGLFHKMGGRAHTSTALSFGEKGGAIGYLVGEENSGLKYMFHMMNEARLLVGFGGAVLANAGYQYSLQYAKERPQGRLPSCKDPLSPPVNIIEHADVKRMLLAQKCYAEGAMSLVLYGTQLFDDQHTAKTQVERERAFTLLDFLTPIIKTWPAEYGTKANDLAIQVLGGHGYINEHPVEMFYRDNRLNAIHEGTTGIQSLDLLTRKVPMKHFSGYQASMALMTTTIEEIKNELRSHQSLNEHAQQLSQAISVLDTTTKTVFSAMETENIDLALANSVHYLSLFGHIVVGWLWLKQAKVATLALEQQPHIDDIRFYQGKLQATKYFYQFELPMIKVWQKHLTDVDPTCYNMHSDWF